VMLMDLQRSLELHHVPTTDVGTRDTPEFMEMFLSTKIGSNR